MTETYKAQKSPFEFTQNQFFYRGNLIDTGHLSPRTVQKLMVSQRILLTEGGYGFGGISAVGKNGDTGLVVWALDGALRKFQLISMRCQTIDEAKTTLEGITSMFGD